MSGILLWTVLSVCLVPVSGVDPDVGTHCPSYVEESRTLTCDCRIPQGIVPQSLSITWPGVSSTSELRVSNVRREDNGTQYTCQMELNGDITTAVYTLLVAYGPTNASTTIRGPSPFPTDGSQPVTLTCEATDVNPVPRYSWTNVACSNGNQQNICTFTPSFPGDDGKVVMCKAVNPWISVGSSTAWATFTLGLTEVTTQRTSPTPPTSHQPPPATSTVNTFPVTTQDTASPTNTYPWDIHLSCPAGDWRSGTELTLTCSLLKASYPSKCTEAHANVLHFLVTSTGTSAPTQSCTVTGFTGCSPFLDGQAGCRCVQDNATMYNFQYKFTVAESHTGTWDCSVSCFDAALRDSLFHTTFNCDNKNAVVEEVTTTTQERATERSESEATSTVPAVQSLRSSVPVEAIAGGVIGGVVLLVVIAVIAVVVWKRNRDQRYEKPQPGRNQEINPYTNLHVNIDPLQPSVHYANTEPRPDLSQAEDPAGYMNVETTNTYDTLTSTSTDVPTYTQLSAPGTMDTR